VADTIHVLGEGGVVFEMTLPLHEAIQDRLTQGFLKRANPDGSLYVEGDEPPAKPAVNAPKAEWVGWAVQQGADPDDALALTKSDLIDKYGK
jgi:hypothetical protein